MTLVYLGLGSNLGDREGYLRQGVRGLHQRAGDVIGLSPIYETAPQGYADQPRFLNMVVCLQTPLDPLALLDTCLALESAAGRTRPFPNAPRTLDIDILLYDERVFTSERLTVPHPRMAERAFVLIPLSDLAADVVHPTLGISVGALARRVGHEGVRPWSPPPLAWLGDDDQGVRREGGRRLGMPSSMG
ncbi:MAG: 2-amino-4-hydroxy-6-hydroxymethyldihydropteridine diphosphokinase [Dehalococcoidia bacterium]|nr:2-amino-4-hydroxy-6-hydroxymethyldihydropteridine diphosphokinase [Dehalococcoidia bacterium]MDW8119052.1 2-amino-4-hydroxy-6-hydroxymethyldihydropteridine diphosphokinase [Chloroflexota bacterium]